MSEDRRDVQFWNGMWTAGYTGWHKFEVHEKLMENYNLVFPSQDKGTILVPLCGKTLDVIWLYNKGHHVIGIEGVEYVVKEFFQESKISYEVVDFSWGKLYQSLDKRLQVYACDLFSLDVSAVKKCDAVWDRGSIVAISECDRLRYAALMKQLLLPQFNYLMSVMDYTSPDSFSGPPCSIPLSTIEQLFGDVASCRALGRTDQSDHPMYVRMGLTNVYEHILLLSNKQI